MDSRNDEQYQQAVLDSPPDDQPQFNIFTQVSKPLSKKQQQQLLFGIKIHTQYQNLLDLTCEETNPPTSRIYADKGFVEDRAVEILGPITIQEGYITSYKLYKIRTKKLNADDWDTLVQRRFSDFQYLHAMLTHNYGGYLVPKLPEKNMLATINMESTDYVKIRKQKLKKYLQKILAHSKLRVTQQFLTFLFDPQKIFSQKKGQYTSQFYLPDTVYKLTTDALQTGYSVLTHYIGKTGLVDFNSESIGAIKSKIIKSSKEDQQIWHHEVMMDGLTNIVRQIKIIVQNTCQEANSIQKMNEFFKFFTEQEDEQKYTKNKSKNKKLKDQSSRFSVNQSNYSQRTSKQFPLEVSSSAIFVTHSSVIKSRYHQLLQSYQDLFQFIQSCKQAINRRYAVSFELYNLKHEQQILQQKSKNNPRNINLDIIRSKILQVSKKSEQFTQQLLQELQMQTAKSKSMVSQFLQQLEQIREDLYNTQF